MCALEGQETSRAIAHLATPSFRLPCVWNVNPARWQTAPLSRFQN
ncbi:MULTISPECIES: hypothetical protein [Thermoleptolyngbya]|nr:MULTISPECIES: hypothetical protein [Thermoleptolyngbya]